MANAKGIDGLTLQNRLLERQLQEVEAKFKIHKRRLDKRKLVRRRFVLSIAAAWVITVPASALLSASLFYVLHLL